MPTSFTIQQIASVLLILYVSFKAYKSIWNYNIINYTWLYQITQLIKVWYYCKIEGLTNRQKTAIKRILKDQSTKSFRCRYKYKMLELLNNSKTIYVNPKGLKSNV